MLGHSGKRNNRCDRVLDVTSQPKVGAQRPGGRAARVRAAVLQAAAELLVEVGYELLSVEEVANRAGVHKTTVYRRWPGKADLIADATRLRAHQEVPIPDTGTLEGDLQALAHDVVANIGSRSGGAMTRAIVSAAAGSEDLTEAMHGFWSERLALTESVVERAIERGELPSSADANLIIEALIGPLWVRLLLTGEPIDEGLADRVAELVCSGAQAM